MGIFAGLAEIGAIKAGAQDIAEVYAGTTKVWPNADPSDLFDTAVLATSPTIYYPCRVNENPSGDNYQYTDLVGGVLQMTGNTPNVSTGAPSFGFSGTQITCDTSSDRPNTNGGGGVQGNSTYMFVCQSPAGPKTRLSVCGNSTGDQTQFNTRSVLMNVDPKEISFTTPSNPASDLGALNIGTDVGLLVFLVGGFGGPVFQQVNNVKSSIVSSGSIFNTNWDELMVNSNEVPVSHLATWNRRLSAGELTNIWNSIP